MVYLMPEPGVAHTDLPHVRICRQLVGGMARRLSQVAVGLLSGGAMGLMGCATPYLLTVLILFWCTFKIFTHSVIIFSMLFLYCCYAFKVLPQA